MHDTDCHSTFEEGSVGAWLTRLLLKTVTRKRVAGGMTGVKWSV
jgi:hypothetical protein